MRARGCLGLESLDATRSLSPPPLLVWAWSLQSHGPSLAKKTPPIPEGTTSAECPASPLFSLGNVYFFPGSHPRYTPAARAGFGQEVFGGEKGSHDDMRWLGY